MYKTLEISEIISGLRETRNSKNIQEFTRQNNTRAARDEGG